MNEIMKKLEANKTIEQFLPNVIDSFVSFYGEENRNFIEEKLSNAILIGYIGPKNLDYLLYDLQNKVTKNLIDEFFDENNVRNEDREKIKDLFFNGSNLNYENILPFQHFVNYINHRNNDYGDFVSEWHFLHFLNGINPEINMDNINDFYDKGFFNELEKFIPSYEKMLKRYSLIMKDFERHYEIRKTNEKEKKI